MAGLTTRYKVMTDQFQPELVMPANRPVMVRPLKSVSTAQRERALETTEYNVFSFPADLLTVDLLSDSGTTTMTDLQCCAGLAGNP